MTNIQAAQVQDSLNVTTPNDKAIPASSVETVKEGIVGKVDKLSEYLEILLVKFVDAIPSIIAALLGLFVGLFLIRTILKIIRKRFEKQNVDISLRNFLISIIKFVLYAILILVVIQNLGFQTTAILGALSGMVLAVGLALQGSLANFAGGVLILLFRPFEVGDYIENNSGTDGTVEKIDLLYTTLTSAQGIKVYSPNGALANSVIRNFTQLTSRRFEYVVGISYDANIKTAQNIILDILKNDSRVNQEPAPDVFVSLLADSAVNLTIRAWATKENYWSARNNLQEEIKIALDKAGISIPFPQREMRIVNEVPKEK
ncbi:mechanosensitive ion channel [Flavobacterium sp. NST-5]|uniref:Mechanosensitive ion channel n=2 Tax=Flavobacterium ichthyis TaxID=2698827 RepID=A0ABW9Z706_9FLAO|nr:mechanosensitive ion channel [Flavobacterium ichthyis]